MAALNENQPAPEGTDIASKVPGGSKLRVLHILESYPPDYGGGAAITTRDICRALVERGHEVRVLCTESADRDAYTTHVDYDGDVRVERINLPYFRRHDPDGWQLSVSEWQTHEARIRGLIEGLLDDWKPDLVDYHTSRPLGEECLLTIARRGFPLVATLHEGWLICPRLMLLRSPLAEPCSGPSRVKCLECMYSHYDGSHLKSMVKLPWRLLKLGALPLYRLNRRAKARGVISGALARSQFMQEVHKPHLHGPIIHEQLGIDLSGRPKYRAERPRSPLRFGFAGGFQRIKGITDVLDAAVALKRDGFNFEVHVWGPSLETGGEEVSGRGLDDRVFLRGMYAPDELWSVYSEIDVALMATTVCESLGRIPLEAAASGAPTIAPAIGGITETIRDGVDGLLYKFRDPKDLEQKMRRILEEPGLVGRLIENLRPVPDTRERAEAVEAFYYRVLGIKSESPAAVSV
jgi:glycosyltransferase involved in cell wall biosynthesis